MKSEINFKSLVEKSNKYGEKNDCAVKALAVVLGTSYEDSHTLNKSFGRKDGKGTSIFITLKALESRNFKFKTLKIGSDHKNNITVKNFERLHLYKYKNPLLILTASHIAGVRDGIVHDHVSGSQVRIKTIIEIIPTENSIHSVEIEEINIKQSIIRKKEEFKYVMRHKETKEIYIRYKRKPGLKVRLCIDGTWITGLKNKTLGKLEIVEI